MREVGLSFTAPNGERGYIFPKPSSSIEEYKDRFDSIVASNGEEGKYASVEVFELRIIKRKKFKPTTAAADAPVDSKHKAEADKAPAKQSTTRRPRTSGGASG